MTRPRLLIGALGVLGVACGDGGPHDAGTDAQRDAARDAPVIDAGRMDTGTRTDASSDVWPQVPYEDVAAVTPVCPVPRRALSAPDLYEGTLEGANQLPTGCGSVAARGPEDVFTLHVAQRGGYVISTESERTTIDSVLSLRRVCTDASSALACASGGGAAGSHGAAVRAVLDPGDYTVVVDQYVLPGSAIGGPYALWVDPYEPALNATCAGAFALGTDATLPGQTTAFGGSSAATCRTSDAGAQLYYQLEVPARTRLRVEAAPQKRENNGAVVLRLLAGCDAAVCLNSARSDPAGAAAVLFVANSLETPQRVVVAASGSSVYDGVVFDLAVSASALTGAAACASAPVLIAGTPLRGQDTSRGGSAAIWCRSSDDGPQSFYAFDLPAGRRVRFDATAVTADVAHTLVMRVADGCTANSCLASGAGVGHAGVEVANTTAAARRLVVTVGSNSVFSSTRFDLVATLSPL